MMRKIQVPKTHYIKEIGDRENANIAWMVCHGYGQLVEYFSKKFTVKELSDHYLIFPEAPNHFYLEGFTGKVGATWMTKYQREDAIADQQLYLSEVAENSCFSEFDKRVIMGFSQGVHTVVRWVMDKKIACDVLVLWGAGLPEGYLKMLVDQEYIGKLIFVLGSEDKFIPKETAETYLADYKAKGLRYELLWYEGPHDVVPAALRRVVASVEEKINN